MSDGNVEHVHGAQSCLGLFAINLAVGQVQRIQFVGEHDSGDGLGDALHVLTIRIFSMPQYLGDAPLYPRNLGNIAHLQPQLAQRGCQPLDQCVHMNGVPDQHLQDLR